MSKKPVGIGVSQNVMSVGQDEIAANLSTKLGKFQIVYDKCSPELQQIFLVLVNKFATYPVEQYATDKPDYRFSKGGVFCCTVLQSKKNCLLIQLRVDNHNISSNLLTLEVSKDSRPGKRWLDFRVNHESQINEAFRILEEASRFND